MMNEKASEAKDTSEPNQGKKLVPITVRFTADAMGVIDEVAKANRMSKAELVRMAVDDRLIRYLKWAIFINEAQGEEIRKELYELGTILAEMKNELHRIGVNINQQTKTVNTQYKYGGTAGKMTEKNNLEFSVSLESIMRRFERAAKKAGDAICHILG